MNSLHVSLIDIAKSQQGKDSEKCEKYNQVTQVNKEAIISYYNNKCR